MSTFTQTVDDHSNNPKQLGENLHDEYSWSKGNREKIVQLFFQINRCDSNKRSKLTKLFSELLEDNKKDEYIFNILCRMIMYSRDLIDGKGERKISYDFVYELAKVDIIKAKHIIKYFAMELPNKKNSHQYGFWGDLQQLWSDYKWDSVSFSEIPSRDRVDTFIVKLINEQLEKDKIATFPSLLARWIPREKSKYKELFNVLVRDYYSDYFITAGENIEKLKKAEKKACMNYRKIISSINKRLDTVQIYQCGCNYKYINYKKVTSITMNKQKNAFLNKTVDGKVRSQLEDRIIGAERMKEYLESKINSGETVQGKRVSIYDFIKDAIKYNNTTNNDVSIERQLLNSQWDDAGKLLANLENYVAMVDTSGSMYSDDTKPNHPLYNSIGLGLRIAEKSTLGRRVLSFNSSPSWIKLDNSYTLCEMVNKLVDNRDCQGFGTNFTAALTLILDSIKKAKLTNDVVKDMALIILSDMQINYQQNEKFNDSMWEYIVRMYKDAGEEIHGVPYDVPAIVFWNLRTTDGFPTLTTQVGASMLSGANPGIINSFCTNGISSLRELTPWDNLIKLLSVERYDILE